MRIIQLVDGVHMGLSHDGLARLLETKFRIKIAEASDDALFMFLNTKKDKLKILGKKGVVIGYLRMPGGRRIMMDAIQYLPATFGGQGFNYDEALRRALTQRLSSRERVRSPLEIFRARRAAGLTNSRTTQQ